MLDKVYEFIYKYYIEPAEIGSGYNIIQEITYGAILAISLYLFYKALIRLNVKIDEKFAIPSIVFSILIALIRALVDLGYIERSFLTITPGIVFVIGGLFIITILTTAYVFKEKYYKVSAVIGFVIFLYFFSIFLTHIHHLDALIYVAMLVAVIYISIFYIDRILKLNILQNKIDSYAIIGQAIDASATAVGLAFYGYWEQHPIPRFFMEHFGAFSFIPIKILAVLLALYVVNREVEDENIKNIIKLCIMALGMAPGMRDLFRMIMGV
ncbi:hypothetical protein J422_03104 [Methanocaldococcus villosus KIN24-T80]|uniref:DUF63 family protein n=1 Tax=Methanocaldococcus villosus KIN24-T80 TaxID=1069083 RepID=N6UVD3_9EURY|nr:DUF63 family protein [Methanocaldococcus villosus]ENN96314.1 hypothetical protein J422_03104 [Methanocaldococcus villosus KIN24-T80]